jgi:FkbM family methyltransferase
MTETMLANPDACVDARFLRGARGVIHVGANSGRERSLYARFDLNVLWIEPLPHVFAALSASLAPFPRQRALRALVGATDGDVVAFHVADNGGASSSMFPFGLHREVWPDVRMVDRIAMRTTTLPRLLEVHAVDPRAYDRLVLDVQGAELAVLRGAASMLTRFHGIKAEAADFPAYVGGCLLDDVVAFMARQDFTEHAREPFARQLDGRRYYNLYFERRDAAGAADA